MRVVRNLEERSVGAKGKSPKQGLTSTKDLTIELPEGDNRLVQFRATVLELEETCSFKSLGLNSRPY